MPPQPPPGIEPAVRNASRVVLLDARDRILLFRWEDERLRDVKSVWITPGGGLDPGESHEAAAQLFLNHPHFTIFPGESVELMECLPIPGM